MGYKLFMALASIAVVGCGYNSTRIPGDALVVRNGTVIDGTGGPPIANGVVAIQGERIVAVGEADSLQIPEDARVVDAAGGTILPGVINSHTHSTHDATVRRAFLTDGVTTVCNLGTSLDRLPAFENSSVPEGPAARVYWAGPIITAPGGYPGPVYGSQFSYEVGSPEEARAAVERAGGVVRRSLLVGDTETDAKTAAAAGVPVVLVTFGPEGRGVARFRPTALLDRFADLPTLAARLLG